MSDSRRFAQLIEELDFRLAERRHLHARGVHLIVTHLGHAPQTLCAPGEMIGSVAVAGLPESFPLGLTHMSLLVLDCLCRHRLPLAAQQIEYIMNTDPFYVHYAANRIGGNHC